MFSGVACVPQWPLLDSTTLENSLNNTAILYSASFEMQLVSPDHLWGQKYIFHQQRNAQITYKRGQLIALRQG